MLNDYLKLSTVSFVGTFYIWLFRKVATYLQSQIGHVLDALREQVLLLPQPNDLQP